MYQFNGVDNFLKLHLNLNSYHFIRYRLNDKCCLRVELPSKNPNPCRLCTALQNLVYFRVRNGCFAGNTHIPWKIWQKEKKQDLNKHRPLKKIQTLINVGLQFFNRVPALIWAGALAQIINFIRVDVQDFCSIL